MKACKPECNNPVYGTVKECDWMIVGRIKKQVGLQFGEATETEDMTSVYTIDHKTAIQLGLHLIYYGITGMIFDLKK